jgi:hypothetical protein
VPLSPDLDPIFQAAGQQYNVDPLLLKAVAMTESRGNPGATSPAGAEGLMQLMPDTATGLGAKDPYDPKQAIPAAAKYLSEGLDKYGSPAGALMYYAGGPNEKIWGPKTQAYPGAVAGFYAQLAGGGSSSPAPVAQPGALASAPAAVSAPRGSGGGAGSAVPSWAGDSDALKGPIVGAGGQPMQFQQAGGGVKVVPDQPAPQVAAAPQADPLADPTIQALIQNGIPKAAVPNPLASVPQAGVAQPGTPIMDPQAAAAMLKNAYATPGMAGAVAPLVSLLGQGLPRQGMGQYAIGPNGQTIMRPVPGSPETEAAIHGAQAGAEAAAKAPIDTLLKEVQGEIDRRNAASAPKEVGPGDTVFYPPGSPNAGIASAPGPSGPAGTTGASAPATPGVPNGALSASPGPGGGTVITGTPPNETTKDYFAELNKLGDQANAARLGLYQSQLLQQQLHAIGTSGPATDYIAHLGALAQQFGVPKDTVDKYVNSANVQNANKLSQDLLGEVLKSTFPQRITNADITAWQNTVPRATNLSDANDFLFSNVLNPKFQRDVSRYGAAVNTDMEHTPLHLQRFLNQWDNDHPYQTFSAPGAAPGAPAGASPAASAPPPGAIEQEMRRRGLLK